MGSKMNNYLGESGEASHWKGHLGWPWMNEQRQEPMKGRHL